MKAVNLIPLDQRRGAGGIAGRSGGIVYVVVGGLAIVVGLGVLYSFSVKSVADRKGQLADVTEQANAVTAQAAALAPYVEIEGLRVSAVSGVVSLAQQRFDWPDAMHQLALALPNDVTLTTLTGNATAGASASATTASTPVAPVTTPATGATGSTTLATGATGVTSATGVTGATVSTPAAGTTAAFTMSGCASSDNEVATVLTRLAQVPGVSNVSLSTESKGGSSPAPNAGPPVARAKNLSQSGTCPLVDFSLTLSYGSYSLPNQKLAPTARGAAQTVSKSGS